MGHGRYFSLGVDLPLVGAQAGTDPAQVNVVNATPDALQSAGLGDLRVIPRFVALNRDDAPIGLALTVPVGLPTGNDSLVGEGGLSLAPSLALELSDGPIHGREYKVRGLLSGGYRIRPDDRLRDVYVGDQAEFAAAFGWHVSDPVELMLDFHGAVGGSLPAQRPGELLLGSRFYVGDFVDLHLGGGTGVMPGLGSPDWRVVAGLTFAPVFDPALRDSDKDGVQDGAGGSGRLQGRGWLPRERQRQGPDHRRQGQVPQRSRGRRRLQRRGWLPRAGQRRRRHPGHE
jgi:hypothetical protein